MAVVGVVVVRGAARGGGAQAGLSAARATWVWVVFVGKEREIKEPLTFPIVIRVDPPLKKGLVVFVGRMRAILVDLLIFRIVIRLGKFWRAPAVFVVLGQHTNLEQLLSTIVFLLVILWKKVLVEFVGYRILPK